MNIKDFKKGQTVYILNMHTGRNTEPTIRETTVSAIGRKYVTIENGSRYENSDSPYDLIKNSDFGDRAFLCPSREYAEMHIERDKLRRWLCVAAKFVKEYSLEQLRKVREILESEER